MAAEAFWFAAEFAKTPRTTRGFEVNGERFDIVVPRDGRIVPLVLAGDIEGMMELFEGILDGEAYDRFEDVVCAIDEGLDMDQVRSVFHHAIGILGGGMPYWVTQQLVAHVSEHWNRFVGEMMLKGVRPFTLPLHEFTATVYAWLTEGAEKKDRDKFDRDLWAPPPGVESEVIAEQPEWANSGNDFLAQMAARGAR